jgi:hypothetical protein
MNVREKEKLKLEQTTIIAIDKLNTGTTPHIVGEWHGHVEFPQ